MAVDAAIRSAERHHGVTSRWLLHADGVTRSELRRLCASAEWERPTPRTFRRRGSPRTLAQQLAIAVLDVGPGAAISHLSAARWWGLMGCSPFPIHIVRTGATRSDLDGVHLHRVRRLDPPWTTELDGVPTVRPELCALHLFAVCRYERAERLTEGLWSSRLLSGASLTRFIDDMGAMGRNGSAGIRRYLAGRGVGYTPPGTGLESRVQQLLDGAGIAVRRQVDSGSADQWTGRVDFRHVELPLIIEVQSERYHSALVDRSADAARIGTLRAAGFVVVEIWDTEVWSTPWTVIQKVRAAMDRCRQ